MLWEERFYYGGLETLVGKKREKEIIIASLNALLGHGDQVNQELVALRQRTFPWSDFSARIDKLVEFIKKDRATGIASSGIITERGKRVYVDSLLGPSSACLPNYWAFLIDIPNEEDEYRLLKKRLKPITAYHDDEERMLVYYYGPNILQFLELTEWGRQSWSSLTDSDQKWLFVHFYKHLFRNTLDTIAKSHCRSNKALEPLEADYFEERAGRLQDYLDERDIDISSDEEQALDWIVKTTKTELADSPETIVEDFYAGNIIVYSLGGTSEIIRHTQKIDLEYERRGPDVLDLGYFFAAIDLTSWLEGFDKAELFVDDYYIRCLFPKLIERGDDVTKLPNPEEFMQHFRLALGFRGVVMSTYVQIPLKYRLHCIDNGIRAYERYVDNLVDLSRDEAEKVDSNLRSLRNLGEKIRGKIEEQQRLRLPRY